MGSKQKKNVSDVSFKRRAKRQKPSSEREDYDVSFKRKRLKSISEDDDNDLETNTKNPDPENLDSRIIREGMLILGCVKNVGKASFEMFLPGCLYGTVEANNISNAFSEAVRSNDPNQEELEISSFIECGMVFPCKINSIMTDTSKSYKRTQILLSIKPDDVNANLRPSSLYPKMVLYVSICSLEDHGYVVDVGSQYIQGFLPKQNCHKFDNLFPGQVIPTCIQKILFCDKKSAKVQLTKLDFDEEFPTVCVETIKLHSILPGTKIKADIIEVQKHFVIMKYLDFDVCASLFFNGSSDKNIQIGTSIQATVVYVNPLTNMIHVTLHSTPTPRVFHKWFEFQKYEMVKKPKFLYFYKKQAHFKISKRCYGFINVQDLPAIEGGMATTPSSAKTNIEKACVISFFHMSNLIQLTARSSILEKKIILPQDVQVGDIFDAVVKKHEEYGMFVSICIGLNGLVHKQHLSDVYLTKPEILYPVGSDVRCRVLFSDGKGKIRLTCKESLLNLQICDIISSYNGIQRNNIVTGVIVKVTDSYILVSFFNDVKGIVLSSQIPSASIFFCGQTVVCQVLSCSPKAKSLKLSLKTERLCQNPKVPNIKTCSTENGEFINDNGTSDSHNSSKTESNQKNPEKKMAIIKKIKGHQLNIKLKDGEGRIHITELGCKKEGIYPLEQFKTEQKVKVYVIAELKKKGKKYLKINRSMISYKECSLTFPPSSYAVDIKPGDSLIGFINNVKDTFASLRISPTKIGVLDYLHFSESPKVVRKLCKYLKHGLSLKVKVLDISTISKGNKRKINLSKLDSFKPQVGKNILALVQIAFLDRGLILKLPFGYHGSVSITDLSDVYTPVQIQLKKCLKLRFILCHVLEVNHKTKYCALSLRKSRLFGKNADPTSVCPEITMDCIEEGVVVKGLVKQSVDSVISVVIGRNLEGNVNLHYCTSYKCEMCSLTKAILKKYKVGNVIEVTIHKILDGKSLVFTLPEIEKKENNNKSKISIYGDIIWEELQ